jgi:hypothetical protein
MLEMGRAGLNVSNKGISNCGSRTPWKCVKSFRGAPKFEDDILFVVSTLNNEF